MTIATSQVEVGVRDLKNNLSRYLDRVQAGEEVIVTERGRPIARLAALDHSMDRLAELISTGVVRPAKRIASGLPLLSSSKVTVKKLTDGELVQIPLSLINSRTS